MLFLTSPNVIANNCHELIALQIFSFLSFRFWSACKQAGILSAVPSTPLKDSLSAELLGACQAGGDRGCVVCFCPLSGLLESFFWDKYLGLQF